MESISNYCWDSTLYAFWEFLQKPLQKFLSGIQELRNRSLAWDPGIRSDYFFRNSWRIPRRNEKFPEGNPKVILSILKFSHIEILKDFLKELLLNSYNKLLEDFFCFRKTLPYSSFVSWRIFGRNFWRTVRRSFSMICRKNSWRIPRRNS